MGFQIGFPALMNYPPSGGDTYDADAQAMFDKRAAESDEPTAAYKQAISDYVTGIKAVSGFWDDIIQLVVIAGATTVNGARQSIKGLDLINYSGNFVNGDIDPKEGSTGDGATKAWDTGYVNTPAGTAQDDFHMYAYMPALGIGNSYFGAGISNNGASRVRNNTTRMQSNTNDSYTSGGAPGSFGLNRTTSASYERVINNAAPTTVTRGSVTPSTDTIFLHAIAVGAAPTNGWGDNTILIYAMGAGITTLADYQTPVDDLVTALNAI